MRSGHDALLTKLGFERITRWVLSVDKIKLESLGDWEESSGWIYAYVVANRVRYVGITTMVLRSRMDAYRDMRNDRVRPLILAALVAGEEVEIYGLRRSGISKADLENEESRLIRKFESDWNVRR